MKRLRPCVIPIRYRLSRGQECIIEIVDLEDERVLASQVSKWPFEETFARFAKILAPGSIIEVAGYERVYIVPGKLKS